MLIVAGSLVFDPPGVREEFLAMRTPGLTTNRQEPGCLDYVMGADPADPTRAFLFQLWTDQEAFDTHMEKVRSIDRSGGGPAPKDISVKIYDVTNARPASR